MKKVLHFILLSLAFVILALLIAPRSAAAMMGERILEVFCDPAVAERSRAVVAIKPPNTPGSVRLVVDCNPLTTTPSSLRFFLYPGEVAELITRVRHPVLGHKVCRQPLPDWLGEIECSIEDMVVKGLVRKP